MKSHRMFLGLLAASLIVWGANVARAQEEMTKEEWEKQIQEYTTKRNELKSKLDKLEADITALMAQSAEKDEAITNCENELYSLVGATREHVEGYRSRVNALDSTVSSLSRLSNQELWSQKSDVEAAQKELIDLRKSKISLLTEFWDKLTAIQQKIDGLKSTLASISAEAGKWYTVGTWFKDRDCLWNIAKKKSIYDNAFLWPKIWQDNRDKIRDPDLIYTGQRLRIPPNAPLTSAEKVAEKSYWHLKSMNTEGKLLARH
jgi:nucleoid-associated protein YgaU